MFRSLLVRRFSYHAKVCIIGGGPGGITTAAQLARQGVVEPSQISIVEGSSVHHYKPSWTLYAAEDIPKSQISRPMDKMIPWGVQWIDQFVEKVVPEENKLILKNGKTVTYEHLVISSGIKFDFDKTKGLHEALLDPKRNVTSIYCKEALEKHRQARHKKFEKAIFTQAPNPIICAGAPQKILHLTTEAWNKKGFRPNVQFYQAESRLFGIDFYARELKILIEKRKIDHFLAHKLIEVRPDDVAVFEITAGENKGARVEQKFDFLHAVPSMVGSPYLSGSGLTDANNFVTVNPHTCQSLTFKNVWAIGDGSNLPTSKTQAAAVDEALVVTSQIESTLKNKKADRQYEGYTACPLMVGNNKVILAEFKYGEEIAPTFLRDQRKPSRFFYFLKRYLFPFANNYLMSRGLWKGSKTLWDASAYDYSQYKRQQEAKYTDVKLRV